MIYKVGDKFIVEIEEIMNGDFSKSNMPNVLYRIKGFNSLVFDKNGLDKLTMAITPKEDGLVSIEKVDEAYNKGLNDAWELAKKIVLTEIEGGFSNVDLYNMFGNRTVNGILKDFSYQEALAKLEAYEKEKEEIKVGDVVTSINGECENLVTNIQLPNTLHIVNLRNGYVQQMKMSVAKKTGKHIDIQSVLNQIGE